MIDEKTVAKVAKLARIHVSAEEQAHYAKEISGIMQWIEQLGEVPTDGVPQLASVSGNALPWREDKVTDGHMQSAIVKNAKDSQYGCFTVPKVIE